jgi:hypothetical protein
MGRINSLGYIADKDAMPDAILESFIKDPVVLVDR